MFVNCAILMDGPGPSEKVVEINTSSGTEEVIVYSGSLRGTTLDVGKVLSSQDGFELVELPREAVSGKWRIWVPSDEVVPHA